MRESVIERKTGETDIKLSLCLDGGESIIDTGCGFLDHMLELFACHGRFGLKVSCKGDTQVDYHHTVEDIGIALGDAFRQALGDKRGIYRYGYFILPMDESLVLCAADISGRAHLEYFPGDIKDRVGDFDTELVEEFLRGFVRHSEITLHIRTVTGTNTHHIIECMFKSLAHTLADAVKINADDADRIPSSKGVL
ncbi:MAG: imidazoleglycerol-phosphate dehydratase HisB [Firmicutes bacterium]|nr:imidazoleglycerol-phosphate dehydratase HisB [Bacillota bacterium]